MELVTQTPQIVTSEQLEAAIRQEAGLDEEETHNLRKTMRLPGGWEFGRPAPVAGLFPTTIIALFTGPEAAGADHLPGDVRVYAQPQNFMGDDGEPLPFICFVLNRAPNSAVRTDFMNLQRFIEDVGAEYAAMVAEDDSEDDEADICGSCTAELPEDAKFCPACAAPVRRCGNCTTIADAHHRFCSACGVPMPVAAAAG